MSLPKSSGQPLRSYRGKFFVIVCQRPIIFETMNSDRFNSLSLKYQSFAGCKDKGLENCIFGKNSVPFL